RAKVPSCILDDRVELTIWISVHPSPAVIDDDLDLWIFQKLIHDWIFGNYAKVARIDFDNCQLIYHGVIHGNLSPRARTQADHKDFTRAQMKESYRNGTKQEITIIDKIDPNQPIIHASTVHDMVGIDRDDTALVFHEVGEWNEVLPQAVFEVVLIDDTLIEQIVKFGNRERAGGNYEDGNGDEGRSGQPRHRRYSSDGRRRYSA